MIRVLFVCLGNICRSPMAEAIFRKMVKEMGLSDQIDVDSAGTGHWHVGEPPHIGTRRILETKRIDYGGIVARQITAEDFERFDYIVAMDESNVADLKAWKRRSAVGKIFRLLDFVPEAETKNVPDPYFTGDFEETYRLVKKGCEALLAYIIKREGLRTRSGG